MQKGKIISKYVHESYILILKIEKETILVEALTIEFQKFQSLTKLEIGSVTKYSLPCLSQAFYEDYLALIFRVIYKKFCIDFFFRKKFLLMKIILKFI